MDADILRPRARLGKAAVVAVVLAILQYREGAVDWGFLLAVAVLYVCFGLALDFAWHRYQRS